MEFVTITWREFEDGQKIIYSRVKVGEGKHVDEFFSSMFFDFKTKEVVLKMENFINDVKTVSTF